MKTRLFPRFTRPRGSDKRVVYPAIAAIAAIGCLGALWAEANFLVPSASGSSTDLSAWVSQQVQGAQTSTQTAVITQVGTSSSVSQTSASASTQCGTSTGCGSTSCGQCDDGTSVTVTTPCDPFDAAYNKKVTVVLEGNLALTGTLVKQCTGFLVLKCTCDARTELVNIQKLVYLEID